VWSLAEIYFQSVRDDCENSVVSDARQLLFSKMRVKGFCKFHLLGNFEKTLITFATNLSGYSTMPMLYRPFFSLGSL
jgi:hypothetical protein